MPELQDYNRTAYIGLGSNIGNREELLEQAIRLVDEHPRIEVVRSSAMYETAPVGYVEQPSFLNMVIAVDTDLCAHDLFAHLLHVEQVLGRKREIRWGPRTIDLDLLIYDNETIQTDILTVPHPRMMERAFVLIPLQEVLAGNVFPELESISTALEKLDGKDEVILWKKTNWHNESGHFVS